MDGRFHARLKELYPFVDHIKTPLPSCWSSKDKFQYLGLSPNNLCVNYKGQGKTPKDAAAVRADHPIPAACGLYYFEVRIVSKGRDGFMGIGLSQQGVSLNRLPGWDKFSYGYHGDDGNSFCSCGSGMTYGPTFTTGDVIGCGINLVDNTCFYTKNGQNIGVAFTDLPPNLYPIVGLQTPGEVVDANFGQSKFVYDISEDLKEARMRVRANIIRHTLSPNKFVWLNRLVLGYLVHHGYCGSAEAFSRVINQQPDEDMVFIKQRQSICKLVKSGRISEVIRQLQQFYPTLFEQKRELLFMLKCRQFVEMLIGNDTDGRRSSPKSSYSVSPACSPQYKSSSHPSCHTSKNRPSPLHSPKDSPRSSPRRIKSPRPRGSATPLSDLELVQERNIRNGCDNSRCMSDNAEMSTENGNRVDNGNIGNGAGHGEPTNTTENDGLDSCLSRDWVFGNFDDVDGDCNMTDSSSSQNRPTREGENTPTQIERLIQFGRELQQLYNQLKQQNLLSVKNQRMMQDAFSLMAYSNPWSSPVSYQLHPSQREPVAAAINSAILELQNRPSKPALEHVATHACRLREEMARHDLGAAAFVEFDLHFEENLSSNEMA